MRRILLCAYLILFVLCFNSTLFSQDDSDDATNTNFLENGSFEDSGPEAIAIWGIGVKNLDESDASDGKNSLMLELTAEEFESTPFKAIRQVVDPAPMRGKRVRFSAAVKTADRVGNGQATLWMRVDEKSKIGTPKSIAFDNMMDRPIRSDEWGRYEIILDVDEKADSILAGLIVSGEAKAWLDDARMEIVSDSDTKTTGMNAGSPASPFFSPWMFLAAVAIGLMLLSQMSNNFLQRFALKFTFVYWVLYCFSDLLVGGIMQSVGSLKTMGLEFDSSFLSRFSETIASGTQWIVNLVSVYVLQIEEPVVVPTGSGDTSFDWVRVFSFFLIAVVVAIVWSVVWRRDTDSGKLRDATRMWLRYALAVVLLSYGLAKAGFISTQFAPAGMPIDRLMDRSYGESSPMGLLWTFMAASSYYTFFGGLMEVIPAVLLLFRRTMTLGAVLAMAVLGNIVMMNLCYDVPVKQYSMHLAMMGLLVLLPDVPRLMNLFFWNRATEPSDLFESKFANSRPTKTVLFILKSILVILVFAIPIGSHVYNEVTHEHVEKEESEHLLLNRGFRWVSEFPFNR